MATYNAESDLARLLGPHYSRADDEARTLLREIFSRPADTEITDGVLHVRIDPLSAPRRTRALAALAAAGEITRTRVETYDGRLRSGYRLHPPVGLVLQLRQAYRDCAVHPVPAERLPSIAHNSICPADPDLAHFPEVAWPVATPVRRGQPGRDRPSDTPSVQTTLFGRP